MKKVIVTVVIIVAVIVLIAILKPFYILKEGEQAVILRFGKAVNTATEAGLHFKMPVVDKVNRLSKMILSWNGKTMEIPTKEAKYIRVDTTARWRISDIELFYAKIQDMESAYEQLDKIIDAKIKTIIAENNLVEAVRNSNQILNFPKSFSPDDLKTLLLDKIPLEKNKDFVSSLYALSDDGNYYLDGSISLANGKRFWEILTGMNYKPVVAEISDPVALIRQNYDTTSTTLETVGKGRLQISKEILGQVIPETPQYGIEVIDIVIRQIRYRDQLKNDIYERMIQERKQLAAAFRTYGEGQKAVWLGKMNSEQAAIITKAKADAEGIKGQADAEATRIYTEAYKDDKDFYEFWKKMDSYKTLLPSIPKTLTTDLPYFDLLNGD